MASYFWPPGLGGGGSGVSSINALTGDIVLSPGNNITITPSGNTLTIASINNGSVTSVGLLPDPIFSVSASPVTTSGTIEFSLISQNQNLFLASPNGSSGVPTFRAIASGDIPSLSSLYLPLSGGTLTGVLNLSGNATAGNQAVTYNQFNAALTGLTPKGSVKAATTANITLSGAQTVDGVSLVAGDLCLVQAQTSSINDGIYVVASGAWSLASNFAIGSNASGAYVAVLLGSTYGNTLRIQLNSPCVVGTNTQSWQLFDSSVYAADGTTLQLSGNVFSVKNAGIGPTQLANTSVTAGTYTNTNITVDAQGRITSAANGSSSSSSGAAGSVQLSNGSGGFTADGSNFWWDSTNHRLGIGTNAPLSVLSVGGQFKYGQYASAVNANTAGFTSAISSGWGVVVENTSTTSGAYLAISSNKSGTSAATVANDYLGGFGFLGGSGTTQIYGASIFAKALGTWTSANNPAELFFNVGQTGSFGTTTTMQLNPAGTSGGTIAMGQFASTISYLAQLMIQPISTTLPALLVRGNATGTADLTDWQTSAGTVVSKINSVGENFSKHFFGLNSAIPTGAAGTGAGTGGTVSISGNDTAMTVTVTTGTSPAFLSPVATVTYNATWTSAPRVMISPANQLTAQLTSGSVPYVAQTGVTTTTFAITSAGTALAASSVYSWNVHSIG